MRMQLVSLAPAGPFGQNRGAAQTRPMLGGESTGRMNLKTLKQPASARAVRRRPTVAGRDKKRQTDLDAVVARTEKNKQPRLKSVSQLGRATRSRRHRLLLTVCAVTVLTLVFGLLLLNQSRIISLTFANAALADRIESTGVANVQSRSTLAAKTDLAQVRRKAIALGMVEPNHKQIRQVIIPREDELEIYQEGQQP